MEIVRFEPKFYNDLLSFSQKVWPKNPEDYLKFRLFELPEQEEDNQNNLLLLNDEGKIVGCIFYMPTKARVNGIEEKIYWGHDLFVDERYRGAGSLRLMIEMSKIPSAYGIGATNINLKIQKEAKTNFIAIDYHYLIFNIWIFKLLLMKLKLLNNTLMRECEFPDILSIGQYSFRKISNVNELNIPDSGYWSDPSTIDIDLVRDKHFIAKRFFENFKRYHFYKMISDQTDKTDECYFVVRHTIESGFPVISIVDFRYTSKKPGQFKALLKAGDKLGKINRIPLVSFRTSLKLKKFSLFPFSYRTNSKQHIIAPPEIRNSSKILITNADSDTDFLTP
jgi:hypothetical protein